MRYLTASFAVITISLWLGGLVMLAVSVIAIFKTSGLDTQTAGRAASAIFILFGRGQLIVSALALIAVFFGYVQERRKLTMGLFAMLGLGAIGAVIFNMHFVPAIDKLRLAGQADSVEFKSLHRQSEQLMQGITAALFVAAVMLPAFCRSLFSPAEPKANSLPA
jgi:hypothetical protein